MGGVDVKTVAKGRGELQSREVDMDRIRAAGAGRPALKKKREVIELLDELMAPDTAGDPQNGRKWPRKDTREISLQMSRKGKSVSPNTVAKLLKDQNYSLRLNRKTIAETTHPDRDAQFRRIANTRKRFEDAGHPILSVDTKKKELIGNFRNSGRKWDKEDDDVLAHDFRTQAKAIACPYGLLDTVLNQGMVVVGISSDTAEFAVDCIERGLTEVGWTAYPSMTELLLLCDSGGSNGYKNRLWKCGLYHKISRRHGIKVRVCRLEMEPRRTSFVQLHQSGVGRNAAAFPRDHVTMHTFDNDNYRPAGQRCAQPQEVRQRHPHPRRRVQPSTTSLLCTFGGMELRDQRLTCSPAIQLISAQPLSRVLTES